MTDYKTILVALELTEETDALLLNKAKALASKDTQIFVVHAVEHTTSYGAAYGISAGIDVDKVLLEEAEKMVKHFSATHGIVESQQFVKIGAAKFVILEQAEALQADLIITGSHGRHGVRLLLGSTTNAVLHGSRCDVLAVRVHN